MAMTPEDIDALVRANAAAVGLSIDTAHLPGVLRYVAQAAQMAALVEGLDLGPEHESGSVFEPVAPALTDPLG
jgi:hypothetical protein